MVKGTFPTRVVEGKGAHLELEGAELRIVAGPDRGARLSLGADSVLIGSASDCDLVLHDTTVSQHHLEIAIGEHGYFFRDLGSTNGVYIDKVRVERAVLQDGLRFQLGETAISVRAQGGKVKVPLSEPGRPFGLVAHSVAMRTLVAQIERIAAAVDTTVLIEGETGAGKEMVAQAIHEASSRRSSPFCIFDAGAVQPQLALAELFGHEKGAFTGADRARAGLFREAEGGTLFLDEIGELPLDLQPHLLRAVETKRTHPVGARAGSETRHDLRIIAATNRNLGEEVRAKRFREDLFFRLSAARIKVPPLRERREDIAVLANVFAKEAGVNLPPELLVPFASYRWPGNVRELRNTILRLALEGPATDKKLLGDAPRLTLPEARRRAADAVEREYIEDVLARAGGHLSKAAETAGITRQSFTALVQKHGLHPRSPKPR